jgi:serine/threonine-protein kinase
MAKVFTITEGLENLGALKSGGQGSVYKAKRNGDLVSAVKIIPTPISSESDEDKHFIAFRNEVEKLKKVNETASPNIVGIIGSGITSTGNLPFIEMEFIDGPDLGELLTPPHDPVFTVKETIKVAEHLSNALAHCHKADVKHGDIKSNNVKFNVRTGNYMLLDFGLSVMSDEQRRTSIRYAGAIEFMAPEQSAGETLFATDVYSFGIILFELLAGIVPFPLKNKGEMARNAVMIAHMESPVPDMISLRRLAMPAQWNRDKQETEMNIPDWLIDMVYTCLAKDPTKRFRNGSELQAFIRTAIKTEENRVMMSTVTFPQGPVGANITSSVVISAPVDDSIWKEQIQQLEATVAKKEHLIQELKYQIDVKDKELIQLNMERYYQPRSKGISRGAFFTVLIIAMGLGAYAMYDSYIKPKIINDPKTTTEAVNKINSTIDSSSVSETTLKKKPKAKVRKKADVPITNENAEKVVATKTNKEPVIAKNDTRKTNRYHIKRNAFFYDRPNKSTRNNYYIFDKKATLTAIQEEAGFVFVKFVDSRGNTTETWLSKEDLSPVKE